MPGDAYAPDPQIGELAPPAESPPARLRVRGWGWLWLLPPLTLLVALRVYVLHGDPSDFPLDRNIATALALTRAEPADSRFFPPPPERPEFPAILIGGRLLAALGADPIVAGRSVTLAAGLLTAIALYLLGRRLSGRPALGLIAVWLHAILPMAIFMERSLLPDALMNAALTWSIVAAAGIRPPDPRRGNGLFSLLARSAAVALLLTAAALAKLPAVFFAPVAGFLLPWSVGWRRPAGWIALAVVAGLTWLGVCAWYRLSPFNPLPGLERISQNTNNLLGSVDQLFRPAMLRLVVARITLVLTLPGLLLALAGWIALQSHPGRKGWLNLWALLGFLFVWLTLGANTYWAAAIAPVGMLLAGCALLRLARQPRLAWGLPVLAVAAWLDPARAQIADYLETRPGLHALAQIGERWFRAPDAPVPNPRPLFYGQVPDDIRYFTGYPGVTLRSWDYDAAVRELEAGRFDFLLSTHMNGERIVGELFSRKPILDFDLRSHILYGTRAQANLGRPVEQAPAGGMALDLEGELIVLAAEVDQTNPAPGEAIELRLTYRKGPRWPRVVPAVLFFSHADSRQTFLPPPRSQGAYFTSWPWPLLQTPDFAQGDTEQMVHRFDLPRAMPEGRYDLFLALARDFVAPSPRGEPRPLAITLDVRHREAPAAGAPQPVDWSDALWLIPFFHAEWTPRGIVTLAQLNSQSSRLPQSQVWWAPNLAPGDYLLALRLAARPAGENPADAWPVLKIARPDGSEQTVEIAHEDARTLRLPFSWRGPGDYLHFTLANPLYGTRSRHPFPLYPHDLLYGSRVIELHGATVLPAAAGGE